MERQRRRRNKSLQSRLEGANERRRREWGRIALAAVAILSVCGLLFLFRENVGVQGGLAAVFAGLLGVLVWAARRSLRTRNAKKAGASAALLAARRRMEERRERQAEEEARQARGEERSRAAAPAAEAAARAEPEPLTDGRKALYNQALDDHFAEEPPASPVTVAITEQEPKTEPNASAKSDAPMVVARPKPGTPVKDGFMARLRRRAEERSRTPSHREKPLHRVPHDADPPAVSTTKSGASRPSLRDIAPSEAAGQPGSRREPKSAEPCGADGGDALARAMSRALRHEGVPDESDGNRPTGRDDAPTRATGENARISARTLENASRRGY